MEEPLPQEVLLKKEKVSMTDGALIGLALGNAIADQTFRNIIGYKLLKDEERGNDGVGMALLMSNTSPTIKPMIQPPTLGNIYRR